ncbi:MAG TPA: NADH-quinone oxidoreductase subunit K [Deinococcales bacterium]|nr:NADH-quinone oxidoreductase subunit K [Deinococcales bacterium]
MELLVPALTAVLAATGVYLMLSRTILRVVLGLTFLAYAANLAILAAGGLKPLAPPLLDYRGPHMDPLPQALILTAIVIGFGTTALLLTISFRARKATGIDDVALWRDAGGSPEDPLEDDQYADPEHPTTPEEPEEYR